MSKEEITKKIESLKIKVKSPGRTYSQAQREEMRKEIVMLNIQLNEIIHQEDISYIKEFITENPKYYIPEIEKLIRELDYLEKEIIDDGLKFALEFKLNSFRSETGKLANFVKRINEGQVALEYLSKNEKIPFSNPNYNKDLSEIQKYLAGSFRSVESIYNKLILAINEIQTIVTFFNNDNNLFSFTYLSEAKFSEATSFEEGIAIVHQGPKKMYFAFNGIAYKIESEKDALPIINKNRVNPDLLPFEIEIDYFNKLMGYKNSNGEIIIPAKFAKAYQFVNGFAKVGILKGSHIFYGLINQNGEIVLPFDFIELDDVHNDIVLYKKYIYKEGYERTSSFNFDMKYEVKNLGLHCGYLIFGEIKPALIKEIENIKENNNKTREVIEYYLRLVTNN